MTQITVPDYDNLILSGLSLRSPATVNRSKWTGVRKVVGLPGAELWRATIGIDRIATEAEERQWRAFLFGLRGPVNWFRWNLPCNSHIGPAPKVDSGAAAGYTLPLKDMQPNALILRAGQFMTVPLPSGKSRAVVLTSDLVSDGSGDGTATFEPALPEAAAVDTVIETANPWIAFSLTIDEAGMSFDQGVSDAVLEVEEAR